MKIIHLILSSCLLAVFCMPALAQYETVVLQYERNYFNQGQPLPAESYIILSGAIRTDIEMVEVDILRPVKRDKEQNPPLYSSAWKRSFSNKGESFEVPINFKLRGNNEYDVILRTFRMASKKEKENLRIEIQNALNSYVEGIVSIEKRRLDFSKPTGAIIEDLNDIVLAGTQFYRNKINFNFPGFSDIVANKLQQLNNAKLKRGIITIAPDKFEEKQDAKRIYFEKLVGELKTAINAEIGQLINSDLLVLDDLKEIRDYPSEQTKNILSINAGYGGVYFDGGLRDLSYDHAPYLGLSFPFGNSAISRPFWSNTSFSVGAFVTNFEDENGTEVTGPIFQRPYYLGLGYKAFQFIRINAGATFLEEKREEFDFNINEVRIKPFVGVSAEINLWLGLGNKR